MAGGRLGEREKERKGKTMTEQETKHQGSQAPPRRPVEPLGAALRSTRRPTQGPTCSAHARNPGATACPAFLSRDCIRLLFVQE